MPQFMHIQLLSSTLELILNQALEIGDYSTSVLTSLESKSLSIELRELNATLCLTAHDQKIIVTSPKATEQSVDCKITTSFKTLIELKNEQKLTQLIKDSQLDICGDIKIAKQYANLFESLNIDWPSELEKHIGDITTHKLLGCVQHINKKITFAQRQISADANEYLVHEKKWVATKVDIDHFTDHVSSLTQNLQHIEQQFSAFASKLEHFSQQLPKKG